MTRLTSQHPLQLPAQNTLPWLEKAITLAGPLAWHVFLYDFRRKGMLNECRPIFREQFACCLTGVPPPLYTCLQIRELVPESQAYMDLLAFERKLDQTIMRKRLDIQEALKRPIKVSLKVKAQRDGSYCSHIIEHLWICTFNGLM